MTPYLVNFNNFVSPDPVEGTLGNVFAAMNNSG